MPVSEYQSTRARDGAGPLGPVLAGIVAASLLLGALAMATPSHSLAQTEGQSVAPERKVPFLTLRDRTSSAEPGQAFGSERSDLKAGWCGVRQLELGLLSPLADPAPAFLREHLLRVNRVTETEVSALLDSLHDPGADRPPLLYVHGYFIGFEKGCRRAVLLQENADLAGRLLWFSWPSDGLATNYMQDEADLYWSVPGIADAILELERRSSRGRVDVIGHSLGARGVVLALLDVAYRRPDARLGEIVLLAPDMDFDIFAQILPRITSIVGNMTIYVTAGDGPLALSARLHGRPRLGQVGNDLSGLAGVEVIDLSQLPGESPSGHLYHIHGRDVGDDLSQLLNERKHAAERRNLVRTGTNAWSLEPGGQAAPE